MRYPARFVAENLIWSVDGGVWAMWRIDAVSYRYLSNHEKVRVYHRLRGALMTLPTHSMLLSVCRQIDPYAVVERMIAGVDVTEHPEWRSAALRTLDHLQEQEIYDRYFFVAAKLGDGGLRRQMAATGSAATAGLLAMVGMAPPPPTRQDLERRRRQAAQLGGQLGTGMPIRPVTPAEIRWLYTRAAYRGLAEPVLDEEWNPDTTEVGHGPDAVLHGPSLVHLVDAVFHEGGDRNLDAERPRHRRYLRVETETGVSYQTFMVMAGMPRQWTFPGGGGEWFVAADAAPFPVDWCARITAIPNRDAQLKSRRQARQLRAQVDEYQGEPSGPPASLSDAMDAVDAQRSELSSSPATPELRVSMIFALGSWSLGDLEQQAGEMRAMFEAWEYEMPRPTGNQTHLFRAMLPGAAIPAAARDYAQFVLPGGLASGMPIGGTRIGDRSGQLFAFSMDGGTNQPVLVDHAYGVRVNRSASLFACGELGSGKSYAIKQLAWGLLARGGRVVALDRSGDAEYVKFASAAPGTVQVVELTAGSEICIDPLVMFSGTDRVRYATGFLTLLTGTYPTDLDGATLAEAVRDVAERADGRLIDVVETLRHMGGKHPEAETLARKVANFAQADLAKLAFGTGAPLELTADLIVLSTPGLSLPSRDTLLNEQLAKHLLPEQIFSQACLYLIAAISRAVIFEDRDRFAAAVFDEAWALTSSVQGQALLLEGVREGRRHNAAIWLLSQHPTDIGDPKLAELLGSRFVFRQGSGAGPAALRFLGLEATEQLVELVETGFDSESSGVKGQCLYRDVRGRVGRIRVVPAATPELEEAFNTNPATPEASVVDDDYHTGLAVHTLLQHRGQP